MARLVECVPNFSEGRDRAVLDAITAAAQSVDGVVVLDVDPGADTHRTVFTFVGPLETIGEAAFRAIRAATERIDMSVHRGAHPRMGATDVCPFVPIGETTMQECVELARVLGERVGRDLGIPVYLYEHAATRPERRSLADVRAGEYEGLPAKLADPVWAPDFGPAEFNARSGATVIGAREFLIAYNVNLNTRDKKLANEIALRIRENGRLKKDAAGQPVLDGQGNKEREPGRLSAVRAVGWYIEEYGRAQVSINLLDYRVTPLHRAFDVCCEEAESLGLRVTGSEVVGLIPREALLAAGRHYLERQGKSAGVPERERIHIAVRSLGLDELGPFDPTQKIIEERVVDRSRSLVERTVRAFTDEVSTDSPAPGGGSVAALVGALGAALAAMVANLTYGRKGYEAAWEDMAAAAELGQSFKDALLAAVDEDTEAFDAVMSASRRPKATPEERAARAGAIVEASQRATLVPLAVAEKSLEVLEVAAEVAAKGNPASVSDAGVAALCARACAEGAWLNVEINLKSLESTEGADPAWIARTRDRAGDFLVRARIRAQEVLGIVENKIR